MSIASVKQPLLAVLHHPRTFNYPVLGVRQNFDSVISFNVAKRDQLNIYMKRYKATVNAAGMWVETILYAQNPAQAMKLFQAIFGAKNVPHQPQQIG